MNQASIFSCLNTDFFLFPPEKHTHVSQFMMGVASQKSCCESNTECISLLYHCKVKKSKVGKGPTVSQGRSVFRVTHEKTYFAMSYFEYGAV